MRVCNYSSKSCKFCGEWFNPLSPNQRYCSKKCLNIYRSKLNAEYKRKTYKKGQIIREMTCSVCGNTYTGHFNSKYCISCLKEGTTRKGNRSIKRYLYNRADYDGED